MMYDNMMMMAMHDDEHDEVKGVNDHDDENDVRKANTNTDRET